MFTLQLSICCQTSAIFCSAPISKQQQHKAGFSSNSSASCSSTLLPYPFPSSSFDPVFLSRFIPASAFPVSSLSPSSPPPDPPPPSSSTTIFQSSSPVRSSPDPSPPLSSSSSRSSSAPAASCESPVPHDLARERVSSSSPCARIQKQTSPPPPPPSPPPPPPQPAYLDLCLAVLPPSSSTPSSPPSADLKFVAELPAGNPPGLSMCILPLIVLMYK
eukprot:764954-Hanusia_phi.AAC.1